MKPIEELFPIETIKKVPLTSHLSLYNKKIQS